MRYFIFLTLIISTFSATAQVTNVDPNRLLGTWIKTSLTYLNGEELSDANLLKYNFTKYNFKNSNSIWISGHYESEGLENVVEIKGNMIYLRTKADYPINKFRIHKITTDTLIIYESDESYKENPYALKYTFVAEQHFIDHLPLSQEDIHLVKGTDTIYKASQKIHPKFAGVDLNDFFSQELGSKKKPREGVHLVSFIINKQGGIDSLKTIKSMGPKFEEMFEKSFRKTQNMWTPAYLNRKPVSVLRYFRIRYYGSIGDFFLEQNANANYLEQQFEKALPLLKKVLEIRNDDIDLMYKIGICKFVAGDQTGACEDWNTAKNLGSAAVVPLLQKYCSN
ncbi:hypothetical protein D3C87_353610 [compost metagenome]